MDDDDDVHDKVGDSEDIGKIGPCLCALEKLKEAVNPEELVHSDLWVVEANKKIKNVRRDHGDEVQLELDTLHVSCSELLFILNQQTLLQIPYNHTLSVSSRLQLFNSVGVIQVCSPVLVLKTMSAR